MGRTLLSATFVGMVLLAGPVHAQTNLQACDVLDAAMVSGIVGKPMALAKGPPRREANFDGVLTSGCLFTGPGGTMALVSLQTFPGREEALEAYAAERAGPKEPIPGVPPQPPVEDERTIGEKGFWYQSPPVVIGLKVQKDKRHLSVQVEFREAAPGTTPAAGLKERGRPILQAAVRKL